jgi:hypothetical protein
MLNGPNNAGQQSGLCDPFGMPVLFLVMARR